MMKTSFALLVTAMTSMLAGCSLYFGDGNENGRGDGTWNYCGSDGYYQCQDESCVWTGPTCPSGTDPNGGSTGSGFECNISTDCAAGCYCANGTCEEAGFCTEDSDCGTGYVCNEDRSSCEPAPPVTTCDYDNECPTGQYCALDHTCTATCTCTQDEEAVAAGYGWCDETRNTCLPGQDPSGTCGGTVTCNLGAPSCPAGQVPTMIDGCWTGQCRDYATCDIAPECALINDSATCATRQDCRRVMNGINCTKNDGSGQACTDGDTNCTCTSYVFASCAAN
jgi:hypothetical protein